MTAGDADGRSADAGDLPDPTKSGVCHSDRDAVTTSIPETIGRYEIAKVLGQGGMGVVYLGHDPGMGRQVAVKTVKAGADDAAKSRLRIEGRAGKLDHENIVTVYETGQWDGDLPYIAMEFIVGDPLDKLALSDRQLSMIEKLDCIRQVCEGLDYAHLNGVLHRDIKPANIIRRHDGRVKIVDFGIAKVARVANDVTETRLTAPLQVIGTLAYMAPERLRGESRLDGRVDIFATGVLLYFLLTGEEPFTGELQTVMHKLMNEPHPPLSSRLRSYPPFLDQILDRALAKDPDDRYSTAQEFSADLAAVIDELNRGRITGMLDDCRRLIEEGQFQAATDRAGQVLKIDPQNQTGRDLMKEARRRLANLANEERLNNLVAEAVQAVGEKRYEQAIPALEEVVRKRPGDQNVLAYLDTVREKWRVHSLKERLFADAVSAEKSGDFTGAIQRFREAVKVDPDDVQLLEKLAQLEKTVREQEERARAERHIASAKQKLTAKRYTEAIELLEDLRKSRISHPELDPLLSEALSAQRLQDIERRRDHFLNQARKHRASAEYEAALAELDTALKELPSDTMLLRAKREIEREVEQTELSLWITQTIDRVLSQALVSLDEALGTLDQAMKRLPGEERFESLEADLLRRRREAGNQQRRFACLRDAGEALHTGDAEKSIRIIEQYLLENRADAEIDGLMQEARQALEEQRLRVLVAECSDKARTLIDQGRFEQAITLLQPVVEKTGNRGLAKLQERAEQARAEAEEKIKLLAGRIADLRRQGKLTDAIALLEAQPAEVIERPLVRDLRLKLREEQKRNEDHLRDEAARRDAQMREEAARRDALAAASAKTRSLTEKGDWQNAREPLENMVRVYGESDVLTQALATFDRDRIAAANAQVGKAIEGAKAAFVADDREAARKALSGGANLVPFASPALAEEWKRLEKLPKSKPAANISAPVFVAEDAEPAEAQSKSKRWLVLGAAAAVILAGAGLLVVQPWKKAQLQPRAETVTTTAANQTPPSNAASSPPASNISTTPPQATQDPATAPLTKVPGSDKPPTKDAPKPPPPVQGQKPPSPASGPNQSGSQVAAASNPVPPPVVATPQPPVVVAFGADKTSIPQGSSTTLHWDVNNVDSVQIEPGIGRVYRQGNYPISPASNTHYRLLAGNGTVLKEFDVAVVAAPAAAPPVVATVPSKPTVAVNTTPPAKTGPEQGVLMSAVANFQSTIQQALSKKDKECKQSLNAANAAVLSNYCGTADKVVLDERGCEVSSSSEDSARLTCDEFLRYHIIGGETGNLPAKTSFQFLRVPGTTSWRVTKWDRHG